MLSWSESPLLPPRSTQAGAGNGFEQMTLTLPTPTIIQPNCPDEETEARRGEAAC